MEQNKKTIYTIGYSGFSMEDFLQVLRSRHVSVLVDVRSAPFSAYFAAYNRDNLALCLDREHIKYRNYAREFGARQEDRRFYAPEGHLDFERFAQSPAFLEGVGKIFAGMEMGYVFALMCAEKNPLFCHRAILVARAFAAEGCTVVHLTPDGTALTQQDIERQLLDLYYPGRDQVSLLEEPRSEGELLANAYRLHNKRIGYHIEEA